MFYFNVTPKSCQYKKVTGNEQENGALDGATWALGELNADMRHIFLAGEEMRDLAHEWDQAKRGVHLVKDDELLS
jgi:hypothetical protein